ncbi:MAG: hypothetical protein JEZ09_09700 [Salinivirgaceae bacterium]|nr:hypothetical protein [Salinivirgaceae bacterium]
MIKHSKNLLRILGIIAILSIITNQSHLMAQCGMALKEVVMQEIGDATYLKDFRVTLEEGKNPKKPPAKEFSILLNKGSHYRFNIKEDSTCNDYAVLKLYDFSRYYGGNYDPSDGSTYKYFEFTCTKTQVYYLSISFVELKPGCAAAIVSLVQK